jgi:cytochrome c oxidase subunit 1
MLATVGAVVMGVGLVVFAWNVWLSLRAGALAGADPWLADTLEWSTTSPPPPYGFAFLPTVAGRNARWDARPDHPVVTGLRNDRREVLVTTTVEAVPHHREVLPSHTAWPFACAVTSTVLLTASMFSPRAVVPLTLPVAVTLLGWFWPLGKRGVVPRRTPVVHPRPELRTESS